MAIKVVGDREVRAKLKALEKQLRRRIVVEALSEAIDPMGARAIAEAPRDTGELRSGIEKVVKGESKGKMAAQVVVTRKAVRHSIPVELGAPARLRGPDAFLLRAFDAEGARTLQRAINLIAAGIGREASAPAIPS